jgi:VIT1/CCC1 family predicted Fe2+/Mn2+ transporter
VIGGAIALAATRAGCGSRRIVAIGSSAPVKNATADAIAACHGLTTVTGYLAAWIGGSPRGRAVIRTVIGGAIALAATFLVGSIFGTAAG